MQIQRLDEQTVGVTGIDLFCCELLHQIPLTADPGEDGPAHDRFFSSPTGGREPEFAKDWEEFVEPELRSLFQEARDVVRGDLAGFPPDDPSAEVALHIPVKHLEAWIHALNQARLALAARHGFTEKDMEGRVPISGDTRALSLFQIHFYGFLEECFLRQLE
jgi:hypothetical protein